MSRYDHIEEIGKTGRYDHIEEVNVEKFNPFHDAEGKFSSSNGFKTYSANPNTRAGAMAIARSAAAGHGNTANVHRQSYGENITQNAQWIGRGAKTPRGGTIINGASNLLAQERRAGLAGASATGADWQQQNQQRGRKTGPGKQPTQNAAQTKPAPKQKPKTQQQQTQQQTTQPGTTLDSKVSGVKLTSGDRLAIQPRDGYGHTTTSITKVAKDHYQDHVQGKDISKTADIRKISGSADPIDKMARLQGWDKSSTVTNDLETFQKAAKQSGYMLIRTVHGNSGSGMTSAEVCRETMANGRAALGGTGAQVYGSGLYMVGADLQGKTGRNLGRQVALSQRSSSGYGDTQMMSTIHPSAKIATPNQAAALKSSFSKLSAAEKKRFGGDFGTYVASKGYDGARWQDDSDPYVTMYNKSALIFYGGVTNV